MVNQQQVNLTEREKLIIQKAYELGFKRGYQKRGDDQDKEVMALMQPLEALE